MLSIPTDLQDQPRYQTRNSDQQNMQNNVPPTFEPEFITPLYDINDLYKNAQCFQNDHEHYNKKSNQATPNLKKNDKLHITTQFLFGHHMPPYYSVLNHTLMNKYVMHLHNPNAPTAKKIRLLRLSQAGIYFI